MTALKHATTAFLPLFSPVSSGLWLTNWREPGSSLSILRLSSTPWLDIPWKPSTCPLDGGSELLCSQGRQDSPDTCRLGLPLGRDWQGPSTCEGRTPGFSALCRVQMHLDGNSLRAAPAPPIHLSLHDTHPRPRPAAGMSLTSPVSLTSWESFYTLTPQPVSASRPTKKRNSV